MLTTLIGARVIDAAPASETDGTAQPILSLDAAKLQLRVDGDDEDDLIEDAIAAAQSYIEETTVLVLTRRTVIEAASGFAHVIQLRTWPITSIDSISYIDCTGAEQQIGVGGWWASVAVRPVRLMAAIGTRWPFAANLPGSVLISLTAGYEDPAAVPPTVMQAMKLLTTHFYTNRGAVEVGARAAAVEVPLAVDDLLRKWRRKTI